MFFSDYDIRKCINNLECFKYTNLELNKININYLFDKPKIVLIKKLLELCKNKQLKQALFIIKELYNSGYNNNDIILSIINYLKYNKLDLNNQDKIQIYKILSNCYIIINDGVDSLLQVYNCICNIYKYLE